MTTTIFLAYLILICSHNFSVLYGSINDNSISSPLFAPGEDTLCMYTALGHECCPCCTLMLLYLNRQRVHPDVIMGFCSKRCCHILFWLQCSMDNNAMNTKANEKLRTLMKTMYLHFLSMKI